MDWLKISDVKPRKGEDVIVYCLDTDEQFVAFSLGDGRFQFAVDKNGIAICCRPSHWAELPNAPA